MNDLYSPHTGEHIRTDNPAGWMGRAGVDAPDYDPANQGCFWRDGAWVVEDVVPEPAPVPEQVTKAQGKAALITAGLWQAVLDYVAGIENPTEQALAEVALNDTQDWRRDSPFLNQAAAAIGLSNEQLDDLFTAAAQIAL